MADSGRQSKQISCYVTEEWHRRAKAAIEKRGGGHLSDWFRGLVMNAVLEVEAQETPGDSNETPPPEVELAGARQQIAGMEDLIAAQRDRINDYQLHVVDLKAENDRLHTLLTQEQANMERVTLMLPSAEETNHGPRWLSWLWGSKQF